MMIRVQHDDLWCIFSFLLVAVQLKQCVMKIGIDISIKRRWLTFTASARVVASFVVFALTMGETQQRSHAAMTTRLCVF